MAQVPGTPGWITILTGPSIYSGTMEVGREPNLQFRNGFTVTHDPLNSQNIIDVNEATTVTLGGDTSGLASDNTTTQMQDGAVTADANEGMQYAHLGVAAVGGVGHAGEYYGFLTLGNVNVPSATDYTIKSDNGNETIINVPASGQIFFASGGIAFASLNPRPFGNDGSPALTMTNGAVNVFSLTGSLTQLQSGLNYLISEGGISLSTNSLGQVLISGSSGGGFLEGDATGAAGSNTVIQAQGGAVVFAAGPTMSPGVLYAGFNQVSGDDSTIGYLSLGNTPGTHFDTDGGYVVASDNDNYTGINSPSGTINFEQGGGTYAYLSPSQLLYVGGWISGLSNLDSAAISGSLTRLQNGLPYLVGVGAVGISTNSLGQVIISGSGGGGGGSTFVNGFAGTTVTGAGSLGSPFIVSSSVPPNAYGSYVEVGADAQNPRSRKITQGSGIQITDGGPGGNLTITNIGVVSGTIYADVSGTYVLGRADAGLPNALVATGLGGVAVATAGSLLNISSSLVTVAGTGGTSVTAGGGTTYVVSSSAPYITNVQGQGGTAASVAGTVLTISSSAPAVQNIVGQGGTSITFGQTTTVSSSVGADKFGSYLLMSASVTDVNARSIVAGTGIGFTDNGPGNTLVITATGSPSGTIYANLYTPYLVLGPLDANNPLERAFQTTGGISSTDTGARGTFTISSSLVTVAGAGGSTVTNGGGTTYTVSSSAPYITNVQGQGGITATVAGTVLTISGAVGALSGTITGYGGTTVTQVGSNLIVSSSIPPFQNIFGVGGVSTSLTGQSLQISSSITTLKAGIGISIVEDSGSDWTITATGAVSSSIYANVSASYVVVGIDAQNPNERKLTAGTGITITDGGAGSTITIAAGGSPSNAYGRVNLTTSSVLSTPTVATVVAMYTVNTLMTATLPSPSACQGIPIIFKDMQGYASASSMSSVLISPAAGTATIESVSGSYNFVSPFGALTFMSIDGTGWNIIG